MKGVKGWWWWVVGVSKQLVVLSVGDENVDEGAAEKGKVKE